MTPLVSIVIPTYNAGTTLRGLLESLQRQSAAFDWEVIAVDSGSTDDTVHLLREHGAAVVSIPPGDFNHGTTRNMGLARATGEFAVLLVQDAVPANPEWLSELISPLLEDAGLAGTFARQKPWPHASRLSAHYLQRWIAGDTAARMSASLTSGQFEALSPAERHVACTFDNVCSCVRRAVWRAHPFRTTPIAEDLEWGRDVLTAGWRLAYVPSAVVWHSHDRSVRYELHRTYRLHQRLQVLFDLSTVPTVPSLVRAICATVPLHMRIAAEEPGPRTRAVLRGAGLGIAMPLGQYLGARSAREGRELLRTDGV
jgi:rhamnosyltransferase